MRPIGPEAWVCPSKGENMFKLNNDSQPFSAQPNLYCVWIRADERPNAPFVSVWIDRQMTAFETPGDEHPVDSSATPLCASESDEYPPGRTGVSDAPAIANP
jgi:hypothetical protein